MRTTPSPPSTSAGSWDELLAATIHVLTAAARLIYPMASPGAAARPDAGWSTRTARGGEQRVDWAEFVSLALAGAAANLGGVETALAGRAGSWEADVLRNLLYGTVGPDEQDLLRHRTEPVTVVVPVDELLTDLGVHARYDDTLAALARQAPHPEATGRHGTTSPPAFADESRRADDLDDLVDRLEALRDQDRADYATALTAAVRAAAAALPGLQVPVIVTADGLSGSHGSALGEVSDSLADRLLQAAVAATPPPGAGRSPLQRLHHAGDGAGT